MMLPNTQDTSQNMQTKDQNQNQNFWYISKKTEKLMTAVYMLTDFLSDSEPMKGRLREYALAVLVDIHLLGNLAISERKNTAKKILGSIESILSFLEIASSVSLISAMNVRVLKDEFRDLDETIRAHTFSSEESVIFSQNFFALPSPSRDQNHIQNQNNQNNRGDADRENPIKDREQENQNQYQTDRNTNQTDRIKVNIKDSAKINAKVNSINTGNTLRGMEDVAARSGTNLNPAPAYERRESILKILKEKPDATIKDILKNLPGLGEKTLQRELVSFIAAGLVKKTGERRWSRYSLR